MRTLFTARRLYTPLQEIQHALLFVEDGLITEISSCPTKETPNNIARIDFDDAVIAPGFVDIHMHGGAGLDVMLASQAELPRLGKFLATHGVTGYFPTTVAAPLDQTCAALERPSIWKAHFSATNAEECIRQKIWSCRASTSLSAFGKPRAVTFA